MTTEEHSNGTDYGNFVTFDPATLDFHSQYKLLGGSVIPRPIAVVSTVGSAGPNAAPFSYFNAIGQLPPMIMFSIGPKEDRESDTLRNIRETSECVVHIADEATRLKTNICAVDYPYGVSEIDRADLRTAPSTHVKPVRLIDFPVHYECRVDRIIEIGTIPYHLVLCEVLQFHFRGDIVNERFHVNPNRLQPIGRLAGAGLYTRCTDQFEMLIPALDQAP